MAQWKIDPAHSAAEFAVRHMMVSTVRGGFRNITGTIDYDPEHVEKAVVEATIEVGQMTSTGVPDRDKHLKSPDFLNAAEYPTITFKSKKVEKTGADSARITGDLTIRGTTREVVFDAEHIGQVTSPYGQTVTGFEGSLTINREDFGLTWNMVVEGGGVLVGKEVKISLAVEAALVGEAALA
jgi:polyisoprenoid-binding protein YceI